MDNHNGELVMGGMARASQIIALLALSVLLAACVTTQKGGFSSAADERRDLEVSQRLARTYIAQENWEAARRHLRHALEINSRDPETHESLALVFQNTGELELAEQHYRRALRFRPSTRARNNYAGFLFEQQRYREAADQLEIVAKDVLYENRFNAFVSLGRCYIQLEDFEAAENALRRAHLMNRDALAPLLELAEVYFKLEQYAQSQSFYDRYRQRVDQQTSRSLWLGIRLANIFGDQDSLASFALALENLYPRSAEFLAYRQFLEEQSQGGAVGS